MENLTDLFKLIELTRAQPQYGYILGLGGSSDRVSNLAEHHYLVTFIGWQLAEHLKEKGAKIDVLKVLEFCLIHDLGELFGGDISMPYAKVNPRARRFAKAFEAENHRFLSKFFGKSSKKFRALAKEILNARSNEALIAKVADYLEVSHYKFYKDYLSKADLDMIAVKISGMIKKSKDLVVRTELAAFMSIWAKSIQKKKPIDIIKS